MVKKRSTSFNIVTTLIAKFFFLFGSFIITVLLARLLGPEGKGMVTAILVVPTLIIGFADLGIRQAVAYFIGKRLYGKKEILSVLLIIWIFTSLISVISVWIIYYFQFNNRYSWFILSSAVITIPISLGVNYLKGVFQGNDRIGNININQFLQIASNFLGVLILVWLLDLGVLGAILSQVLLSSTMLFYSVWALRKDLYGLKIHWNKEIIIDLVKKGVTFSLALFLLQLNYRIDVIILDNFVSNSEIGIYSVGTNLAELIWQLPAAIGLVLFSKSANSKTDLEASNRSIRLIRVILPILILICLFIWLLAPLLVRYLYGVEFINAVPVIRYLLPGVLLMILVKILHSDLAGRGQPLFGLMIAIFPLFFNIALNYLLIPEHGIQGAAVASSISYAIAGISFVVLYAKKENKTLREILIINSDDIELIRTKVIGVLMIAKVKSKRREKR